MTCNPGGRHQPGCPMRVGQGLFGFVPSFLVQAPHISNETGGTNRPLRLDASVAANGFDFTVFLRAPARSIGNYSRRYRSNVSLCHRCRIGFDSSTFFYRTDTIRNLDSRQSPLASPPVRGLGSIRILPRIALIPRCKPVLRYDTEIYTHSDGKHRELWIVAPSFYQCSDSPPPVPPPALNPFYPGQAQVENKFPDLLWRPARPDSFSRQHVVTALPTHCR
jgi:hypothetical protein